MSSVMLESFLSCSKRFCIWSEVSISALEHCMLAYLKHIKITFEYFHVSVILNNADVLYLADRYVC